MTEQKIEPLETHIEVESKYKFIEARISTDKDLKILELELRNEMEKINRKIEKTKMFLLCTLGGLIITGFSVMGTLISIFHH